MVYCKLITGAMFAGKTTKLLGECSTFAQHALQSCLIVKPCVDTRAIGRDTLYTHKHGKISTTALGVDMVTLSSDARCLPAELQARYGTFGIDEGQFFTHLSSIMQGILQADPTARVVVAALNGKSDMGHWEPVGAALPYFTEIELLKSVCHKCKEWEASTSKMTVREEEGPIGGADKYMALCLSCRFSIQ